MWGVKDRSVQQTRLGVGLGVCVHVSEQGSDKTDCVVGPLVCAQDVEV